MSRIRSVVAIAVVVLLGAGLAGCAGPDAAERSYRGMPEGIPDPNLEGEVLGEGPTAILVADGEVLAVSTWGSSSCPRAADSVGWDGSTVRISFVPTGGPMCTADMAPTTHEFDVPDALRGEPLIVEIGYSDWDEIDTIEVG